MKTRWSWVIALAITGLGANSYGAVAAPTASDAHSARVHATTVATPPPKKPMKPTKPKKPTHMLTSTLSDPPPKKKKKKGDDKVAAVRVVASAVA